MIQKTRIIVFDADRYDRGLLALAIRSAYPELEVVKTATLLELMHELSAAPVAAVVGDPGPLVAEMSEAIGFARQREPACLFWIFSEQDHAPSARDCVGLGVDGRDRKDSAGYLSLPHRLLERIRAARDMSERHAPELSTLLTSAVPGPAGLIDAEGRFQAVNRELEGLLERPRYQLLATPLESLACEPEDRLELRRRLQGPRAATTTVFDMGFDGRGNGNITVQLRPLGPQTRQGAWWVVNCSEALRKVTAEDSVAVSVRNAELEQLLFAVTHDLQAPLNSLASNARWLGAQSAALGEEFAETSAETEALTRRMQRMLDGILAVSTVRAGHAEPEAVSLDGVLADAIANLQSEIDDAGATIERQPLPTLLVNRQQMVQVFQNLLSNAIKFRAARPPRVRISSQDSGDCLRVVVEDNGIGIDPAKAARIFGLFQRLHTEQEYPGLGIGLAICRQVVRAHGGELFVDSAPGSGASFILEFRGTGLRSIINSAPRGGLTLR